MFDPTVALITTGSGPIVPSAPCPVAGWLKQSLLIISMFLCGPMAAAGCEHSVLLKSDGTVVAFGDNSEGRCDIPALAEGATYTQVAAGMDHTVLLVNDGTAIACGRNRWGQCTPAIFDESICWVRPCRVCRFGFVDRQVMGSLSTVAGYIR